MGKSKAPKVPDYTGAAIATANSGKYSEVTPFGTIEWAGRPGMDPRNPQPGDYTRVTKLSPDQQAIYDLLTGNQLAAGREASTRFGQLGEDAAARQALQDALYRRSTQYYDQNFGDQENQLRSQLINSGLVQGSEAYDRAMRNFGQQRDQAYSAAADTAAINAEQQSQANQNYAISRLAQLLAMSQGQMPQSGNSAGGQPVDMLGAVGQHYQGQVARANAKNAGSAGLMNGLLGLGGLGLGFLGLP
ncbi:MAG: hypothetical protein AzoDbin1_05111 [Azoarcus sp.]|nr:hypothetical protein [Azoarcus sp.]